MCARAHTHLCVHVHTSLMQLFKGSSVSSFHNLTLYNFVGVSAFKSLGAKFQQHRPSGESQCDLWLGVALHMKKIFFLMPPAA